MTVIFASASNISLHCSNCDDHSNCTMISGECYSCPCLFKCDEDIDPGNFLVTFTANHVPIHDSSIFSGYQNVSSVIKLRNETCVVVLTLLASMADVGKELRCTAAHRDSNRDLHLSRPVIITVRQGLSVLTDCIITGH